MSHSLHTEYLELSQFTATDKPAWLTDYNTDMAKIDEHISDKDAENHEYQRSTDAHLGEIDESIESLQNADSALGDRCTSLEDRMDIAETKIDVNKQNIQDNKNDITELQENVSDLMNGHGIADKAITTQMLADHSVTTEKLAYNSVTTDEILNETIQWEDTSPDFKRHITDLDASTLDSAKAYTDTKVSGLRSEMNSNINTINNNINNLSNNMGNSINDLSSVLSEYYKTIYPVGSIYINIGVNPNNAFPGTTWQRIQNGILYCSYNSASEGDYIGENDVRLSANNIPSHTHNVTPTGSVSLSGGSNVRTSTDAIAGHINGYQQITSGVAQGPATGGTITQYGLHSHSIDLSSLSATLHLNTVQTTGNIIGEPNSFSVKQYGLLVGVWKRTA